MQCPSTKGGCHYEQLMVCPYFRAIDEQMDLTRTGGSVQQPNGYGMVPMAHPNRVVVDKSF
jgi:hypothetical protein